MVFLTVILYTFIGHSCFPPPPPEEYISNFITQCERRNAPGKSQTQILLTPVRGKLNGREETNLN